MAGEFIPDDQFVADHPAVAGPTPANDVSKDIINASNGAPTSATPAQGGDFVPDEAFISDDEKYSTPGQQLKAAAEGLIGGATANLSKIAETKLGLATPEDIQGREEKNPGIHFATEIGGLAGSALIPGVGAANVLTKVGEAGAAAVGLAEAAAPLAKIGSAAVKGFIENAVYQSGDELSRMIIDPKQAMPSVETALTDIGLAGVIGAGFSGTVGAISPLWKAVVGDKTEGVLNALANKFNGVENETSLATDEALDRMGVETPDAVKAYLTENDSVRHIGKGLEQSDATVAGRAYQKDFNEFKKVQLPEATAQAFGKTATEVAGMDVSKSKAGQEVGDAIAKNYGERLEPLKKAFEETRDKYGAAELIPEKVIPGGLDTSGANAYSPKSLPDQVIPGTTGQIADKISAAVKEQGWLKFPDSDEMKLVNDTLRNLKDLHNLNDLKKFATEIGNRTQAWPPTPLTRAGSILKGILQDGEASVLAERIGAKEGAEALEQFRGAQKGYRALSELKDYLGERLGMSKVSTSAFGKAIGETAGEQGEKILNRLSGKNNADTLRFLKDNFPEAAERLRQYHVDALLDKASRAAKDGAALNPASVIKQLGEMSPEMREFVLTHPGAGERLADVEHVLTKMNELPHNFSNTARTAQKLNAGLLPTATSMVTLLMGHGALEAAGVGGLTGLLAKDAPDAIKLALLRFLGSEQKVDASAFKTAVNLIGATIRGQNNVSKAIAGVFKAGREVLPKSLMPSDSDREKLDKHLQKIQGDPSKLLDVGGNAGHYMPDHGQAIGQMSTRVTSYLNSLRPVAQRKSPLDSVREPSAFQKRDYNRALIIAQQPLTIVQAIKDGTLTSRDLQHLQSMYPSLASNLRAQVGAMVTQRKANDETIPYKTRVSLSLFLGQPLDSSMTPQAIMAAQAPQIAQKLNNSLSAEGPPAKHSTAKLSKIGQQSMTPGQARLAEKSQGK